METVIQEDADAVGLSILSGAHMTLVPRIAERLKAEGAEDVVLVWAARSRATTSPSSRSSAWPRCSPPAPRSRGSSTSCARPFPPSRRLPGAPPRSPAAPSSRHGAGCSRWPTGWCPPNWPCSTTRSAWPATHVIGTLAELGVADELARGRPPPRTWRAGSRERRRAPPRDARRGRGRAAADRPERRVLARAHRPARCASDHPRPMRDWVRYIALKSTSAAWSDLTETVRTGRRRSRGPWQLVWDGSASTPRRSACSPGACAPSPRRPRRSSSTATRGRGGRPLRRGRRRGTLLGAILDARPGLSGVLVEGPACWPKRTPGSRVAASASGWSSPRATFPVAQRPGGRLPVEEHPPRLGRRGLRHDPPARSGRPCPTAPASWWSSTSRSATCRTRWPPAPTSR